jgi:hypothetical protein
MVDVRVPKTDKVFCQGMIVIVVVLLFVVGVVEKVGKSDGIKRR